MAENEWVQAGRIAPRLKGPWNSLDTFGYMDVVSHKGCSFQSKIDSNSGYEPVPGVTDTKWFCMAAGGSLENTVGGDTYGILGEIGAGTNGQALINELAKRIVEKCVTTGMISNVNINRADMIPSSALVYSLNSGLTNKANKSQEAWTTPALINNWVNYGNGYDTAGYMKDEFGVVHLKGLVKSGVMVTPIFILPVGYKPSSGKIFSVVSNHTFGEIEIVSNGNILPVNGSNAWISLEGISFNV